MLVSSLQNPILSFIMDQSDITSFIGMFSFDIYGVENYVDPSLLDHYNDYGTSQIPSYSEGYIFRNQDHTYDYGTYQNEYYPTYYYVYPTYMSHYPLFIPEYSPENLYYDYYVYVPVNIYYYETNLTYFTTKNAYSVSNDDNHIDPTNPFEGEMMPYTLEQNFDTFQEFDEIIYNIDNSATVVGEEQTTFQIYYMEPEEVLNDAPPVDYENESGLENELESSAGDEVNDVQLAVPGPSTSFDRDAVEVNDVQLADTGPSSSVNRDAGEINDVQLADQGTSSSIDRDDGEETINENDLEQLSASELRAFKKDMSRAYTYLKDNLFNDVDSGYSNMREFLKNIKWRYDRFKHQQAIRIEQEKANKTYDMKSYYFHDDLSILRSRFMDEDDVETYVLYQLLRSINIHDLKEYMENNYKMRKFIVYKKECKGNQKTEQILNILQWEPSKLCTIPEDEPLEITELEYIQNFVKDLNNITRQKDIQREKKKKEKKVVDVTERDRESVEDQHPPSTSRESTDLQTTEKTEISTSKEMLEFESPVTAKDLYSALESLERTDLSKISVSKKKLDSESLIIVEDLHSSPASRENTDLPIPKKVEISPSGEQLNTVADLHPSVEDKCGLEDTPEVSLNEEIECLPEKTEEDSKIEMRSGDKMKENGRLILDVTEPTLAAAAQQDQPKKRFSSIRKFLSRMCCCAKTTPSS